MTFNIRTNRLARQRQVRRWTVLASVMLSANAAVAACGGSDPLNPIELPAPDTSHPSTNCVSLGRGVRLADGREPSRSPSNRRNAEARYAPVAAMTMPILGAGVCTCLSQAPALRTLRARLW